MPKSPAPPSAPSPAPCRAARTAAAGEVARKPAVLPKSDGPDGVAAWIASLEPWQADLARRVDALAESEVGKLRKAIRWHCPFYGVDGQGWFLAMAAFQRHLKLTFFKGTALHPVPPVGAQKDARSLDLRRTDTLDEAQLIEWLRQCAVMPGWDGGSPRAGGDPL